MIRVGLKISGAREASEAWADLPAKLQGQVLYAALHRSAAVIQDAIKRAAPVGTEPTRKTRRVGSVFVFRGRRRTKLKLVAPMSVSYDYGHLRDNVRRRRLRAGTGEIGVQVTKGRAFWAFFLERGTRRMRPHPFWQAASRGAERQARIVFEQDFAKAVQTALARNARTPNR